MFFLINKKFIVTETLSHEICKQQKNPQSYAVHVKEQSKLKPKVTGRQ